MKTVAVTGGIGGGKSTVCSILKERGIPVYDSDSAAKRLYAVDENLLDSIEEAFGCGIRLADGTFDARKLASIVFSSPEKLRTLEEIVHPAVKRDFLRWKAAQADRFESEGPSAIFFGNEPFCVIESAIILNKPEFLSLADKVVMVDAPLALRLQRACGRDGASQTEVIRRMAAQSFDLSKVDLMIRNDGSFEELKSSVAKFFSSI